MAWRNIYTAHKFHHVQVRLTKVDTPIELMQPVVTELINRLKGIQPQQADILQQFVDYKVFKLNSLAHAKQQLAEAGISPNQLVLRLPELTPPTTKPLGRNPGTKRPPTSKASQLGASPKKRSRGSVVASQAVASKSNATWNTFWNSASPAEKSASYKGDTAGEDIPPGQKDPQDIDDEVKPEVITTSEILDASAEILQHYPLGGTADTRVKRWFSSFPAETTQLATKFASVLNDANIPKPKVQEAAVKYGLPIELAFKLPPRCLNQIVSVAAALTA